MKRRRMENIDGVEQVFYEDVYYYTLKVPAGTYTSNSLFGLLGEVFRHRISHLFKHGRWVD